MSNCMITRHNYNGYNDQQHRHNPKECLEPKPISQRSVPPKHQIKAIVDQLIMNQEPAFLDRFLVYARDIGYGVHRAESLSSFRIFLIDMFCTVLGRQSLDVEHIAIVQKCSIKEALDLLKLGPRYRQLLPPPEYYRRISRLALNTLIDWLAFDISALTQSQLDRVQVVLGKMAEEMVVLARAAGIYVLRDKNKLKGVLLSYRK